MRCRHDIYSTQLIASYSHIKDYNYDPRLCRHADPATLDDATQYNLQWGNTVAVGYGTVSAGIDWQKQISDIDASYTSQQQGNTDVYATAQQKLGSVTLGGAMRGDDNNVFRGHNTRQTSASWAFVEGYSIFTFYDMGFKASHLNPVYSDNLKPENSKQWEGGFEELSGPVKWRLSGYRNDIDDLIDSDQTTFRYDNFDKAISKGVEATALFDTGPVNHTVSYDYPDPRDGNSNDILLCRAEQQLKYQLDYTICDWYRSLCYQYQGSAIIRTTTLAMLPKR